MIEAAQLTVDLTALAANWQLLAGEVAPARCGAVVKADAYGLGAVHVVRALLAAGCREFFVALLDEGARLIDELGSHWPRDARLHVLHGALPRTEGEFLQRRLVPVLNGLDQVARWRELAGREGRRLPAAIQVDTGMSRLGLSPREFAVLNDTPGLLVGIDASLIMSHLASAEEPANPFNAEQLQRFSAVRCRWPRALGCLANSSGIFLGRDYHFDLVRPGAALYGVAPTIGRPNPMKPVVRIQAPLIQFREISAGEAVGYNQTWRAKRPCRIATVSVGYADGYLRSASNRAVLHLGDAVLPVVGRVSMDTVTVDATDVPIDRLVPGTPVDVLDESQDVNSLAQQSGTNAYEVLTSLGARYRRQYVDA